MLLLSRLKDMPQTILNLFVIKWVCWNCPLALFIVVGLKRLSVLHFDFDDLLETDDILAPEVDDFVDFLFVDVALDDCVEKVSVHLLVWEGVRAVRKLDDVLLQFFYCRPLAVVGNGHTNMLPGLNRIGSDHLVGYRQFTIINSLS